MPNLVGIGLSQVPTNSMLGGMAYQDPEHASIKNLDLKNLSQINSEIADTAVDVFVYDTRKDSDGGAWRKRTQNTSWYNETLNTLTRGSRKEFPAVAVLVLEGTKLTIYDGDDPDLPMWMVFNSSTDIGSLFGRGLSIRTSIFMLNGEFCVGGSFSGAHYEALVQINIIKETTLHTDNSARVVFNGNISERNTINPFYTDTSTSSLVNIVSVNDVAMTVLPNAPVDSATGLPVPTIAVATAGGTSVIKDDGRVVDIVGSTASTYKGINKIHFTPDNKLAFSAQQSGSHTGYFRYLIANIPNSDLSKNYWQNFSVDELIDYAYSNYSSSIPALFANNGVSGTINAVSKSNSDKDNAIGGGQSLTLLSRSESQSTDMGCYITSDYNTGWMHGDIKGAFLSDTDTANVTGSELITNGTFGSNVNNWNSTLATVSHQTNRMRVTNTATNGWAYQEFSVTTGKTYVATVNMTSLGTASNLIWRIGTASNPDSGSHDASLNTNSTGVHTLTFTASQSTLYFIVRVNGVSGKYLEVDDISVRLAEEDRSVNAKGLQVFGTVTKSAVATGAELVAYSGFSASNYLEQPNNTDYSFGTGDFYVMTWVYPLGTSAQYDFMLELNDASTSNRFYLLRNPNGRLYVPWNIDVTGSELPLNKWSCVVAQRKSGTGEIYVNGEFILSNAWTSSNNLTQTGGTYIGVYPTGGSSIQYPLDGKLSLMRIGAGAISREQVKKMYEDEKCLFHENAKATLYGSSDAVTALAYDDSNNVFHVGTSSGRSEFQGLRRINNTTTAVTTAISASNGLVAEQ